MFQAVYLVKTDDVETIQKKLETLLTGRGFTMPGGLQEFPDGHFEMIGIDKPMEAMEERIAQDGSEGKTSAQRAGVEMGMFPAMDGIYLYITVLPYMELMDYPEVIGITTDGEELATDIRLSEDIFQWITPQVEKRLEAELITTRVQVPQWVTDKICQDAGESCVEQEKVADETCEDVAELQKDLVKAKKIALAYKKKLEQLQSDYDNFRKQNFGDTEKFTDQRFGAFALDLLEVMDNLERALLSAQKTGDAKGTLEGIFLIHKQLEELLVTNKVKPMEVKTGQKFDPNLHYAIKKHKVKGKKGGQIIKEVLRGYTYKGKTLRPAKVEVTE